MYELTSRGRRRRTWYQKRPWPTPTNACGTPRDPAPAGSAWWGINRHNYKCIHTPHTHILSRIGCLPRGVGGSDEEVDHHPITHVETVLDRPEEGDQTASSQLSDKVYTASVCFTCQKQIWNLKTHVCAEKRENNNLQISVSPEREEEAHRVFLSSNHSTINLLQLSKYCVRKCVSIP